MKRSFILPLCLLCLSGVYAQNPISPMGVYIADPASRVGPDGRLYIYGSLDKTPGVYCSDGYHVLASADLKNWSLYRDVFHWNTDIYAPDEMEKNGKFYLYFDTPQGDEYVAESNSPTGPFGDAVLIDGPKQIDPNIFIDKDGQAYYFWGQFNGRGAKMNPDMKTLDKSTITRNVVTEKEHNFHEGSYVVRRGDWYYYTFADISRRNRPTCIGYAMSRSPLGPYEYKGVIIDNYGCDPEDWNNHGSIVEFKGQWYVLYHRATHGCQSMRKACIEPITFREDGTIVEAEMTTQGAAGPLDAFQPLDAARVCTRTGHCRVQRISGQENREELGGIHGQDAAAYKYLDFGKKGASQVSLTIKSNLGGTVVLRLDSKDGNVIGKMDIPAQTDWKTYTAKVSKTQGVHALWLTFEGAIDPQDAVREAQDLEKQKVKIDFTTYSKLLSWREDGGEPDPEIKKFMEAWENNSQKDEKQEAAPQQPQEEKDSFELMEIDTIQFK